MNDSLPDIDVGSPPDTDDEYALFDWWSDAADTIEPYFDDPLNVMVGDKSHTEPRYEVRETEKVESREVPDGNGGVTVEHHVRTETEKVPVGEKKVTTGFRLDVVAESESEKAVVVAFAHSAGMNVRERGSHTRFTHRVEP